VIVVADESIPAPQLLVAISTAPVNHAGLFIVSVIEGFPKRTGQEQFNLTSRMTALTAGPLATERSMDDDSLEECRVGICAWEIFSSSASAGIATLLRDTKLIPTKKPALTPRRF